jgi:hypothetical protein
MRGAKLIAGSNDGQKPGQDIKLYSYVVEHDNGYAPNPYFGCCTLCGCKLGAKNIVQLAKKGDWILGTSGASQRSAGQHGKLIYAMQVDEICTRWQYFNDARFVDKKPSSGLYCQTRGDNLDPRKDKDDRRLIDRMNQRVLISRHFYYFGKSAVDLPEEFKGTGPNSFTLEKKGPGFRNHFDPEQIRRFLAWLKSEFATGRHGEPCYREPIVKPKGRSSTCRLSS